MIEACQTRRGQVCWNSKGLLRAGRQALLDAQHECRVLCTREIGSSHLHPFPHGVALEGVGLASVVQQVAHCARVPGHQPAQVGATPAPNVRHQLESLAAQGLRVWGCNGIGAKGHC